MSSAKVLFLFNLGTDFLDLEPQEVASDTRRYRLLLSNTARSYNAWRDKCFREFVSIGLFRKSK